MRHDHEELLGYVESLEIIDTHEHLPPYERLRERHSDVLREYLRHYFSRDLISAGMPPLVLDGAVMNPELPILDRWKIVEPYWRAAENTGYARALNLAAQGLYGIERISADTIEELNSAFLKTLHGGHYRRVLKEKSRIALSVLDGDVDCDREVFRGMYRVDLLVKPRRRGEISQVEAAAGLRVCCFDDWLQACLRLLEGALAQGAPGFKCALAYERSLHFERATREEAEREFNRVFEVKHHAHWADPGISCGKAFQDYMMHYVLHFANERALPCQYHTGIQEGSGNLIYHSDPALLSKLFLDYPDVSFDLFHISYPYQQMLTALAKNFRNVFIDVCWAHIISPTAAVNALIEMIDAVPANKISAFGGDYELIDGVYGHQLMARRNVSKALAAKVEEGVIDLSRAQELAKLFFYSNPRRVLRLEAAVPEA